MLYNQTMSGLRRIALFYTILALAIPAAGYCAGADAPGRSAHPVMERIEKSGVSSGPWSVAWSPDGSCLSYISDKAGRAVNVRCLDEGGKRFQVKTRGAQALLWDMDGLAIIMADAKGRATLLHVDMEAAGPGLDEPLPDHTAMLHAGPVGRLAMVTWFSEISIGVNVFSEIHAQQDGQWKSVFRAGRLTPLKAKGLDFIKGWMRCGPNPLDGSFLLSEFIDPPALNPYTKVVLVDASDYARSDIFRSSSGPVSLECSWSPSGQRAALVDMHGSLRLLDLEGQFSALGDGVSGCCPSWSPSGEAIFFGGWLIGAAGGAHVELLPDAYWSRAWWSPLGGTIAIEHAGALYMVRNIGAGFSPSAQDARPEADAIGKAMLLRELLNEGLISRDEYAQRMLKIRNSLTARGSDEK